MIEKVVDLFVGFYRDDGTVEKKIGKVIQKNYSNKVIEEFFYSFGPFLLDLDDTSSLIYTAFKLPRYIRLFQLDTKVNEILEYFADSRTVSQIKTLEGILDILKFSITTLIHLHWLTCMQIVLCQHRHDFENSWMGGRDISRDAVT